MADHKKLIWLTVILTFAVISSTSVDGHSLKSRRSTPDDYNYDDQMIQNDGNDDIQDDDGELNDDTDLEDEDEEQVAVVEIKSRGQHFRVGKGSSVWLPCDAVNTNADTILNWKKGDNMLYYTNVISLKDDRYKIYANNTLGISDVNDNDAGEYRCQFDGLANIIHHLAVITLQPPKIIEMRPQGSERHVKVGDELEITCEVTGEPKPKIMWNKETDGSSYLLNSSEVEFRPNSIYIRNVQRTHAGKYVCFADNKVDPPAYDAVSIKVSGKPKVHTKKTIINGDIGEEAIFSCSAHDDPPSDITWYHDGRPLFETDNVKMDQSAQESTLTVISVREEDFGNYTCQASNIYGEHSKTVQLVKEPVLEDFRHEKGPVLVWNVYSHSPLKFVELQYRSADDPHGKWTQVNPDIQKPVHKNKYIIRHRFNEIPTGRYEARVRASNVYGWSKHTPPIHFVGDHSPEKIIQAGVGVQTGDGVKVEIKMAFTVLATALTTLCAMQAY